MIGAFHGTCFLCETVVEKQLIARVLFGVFSQGARRCIIATCLEMLISISSYDGS